MYNKSITKSNDKVVSLSDSSPISPNGLQLGEVAEIEAQMFSFA